MIPDSLLESSSDEHIVRASYQLQIKFKDPLPSPHPSLELNLLQKCPENVIRVSKI